jgi:SAM-dependent methyltransferase
VNATQIAYWNEAGGTRWSTRAELTERVFAPLTAGLLARAAAVPCERVLDIGCGCGGTSFAYARMVGPAGNVRGVDISRPMLAVARTRAQREGVRNVFFVEADAAAHPFEPEFTLATSQFGVMFFDDPAAAFANIRHALARGRLTFMCWRPLRENAWQTVPSGAVDGVLPPAKPADPLGPGPFALADPERVRTLLTGAGFRDVAIVPHDAELTFGSDPRQAAEVAAGFGAVTRRLTDATLEQYAAALDAITADFDKRMTPAGVRLGAAAWIVTASAS